MHDNYITDETCSMYQARGWTNGLGCSHTMMCKQCYPGEPCFIPDKYHMYKVKEWGPAYGEETMMQEIY